MFPSVGESGDEEMEYLVGILLSLGTIVFAAVMGLDRERSFFATVAFVVATYYVLFAVMGASRRTLLIEIAIAGGFFLFATLGFKGSFWLVASALIGHGVFDFVRSGLLQIPVCRTGGRVSAWHST